MNKYKFSLILSLFFISFNNLKSQNNDSIIFRKIFDEALSNRDAYNNLHYLCKRIGGRLTGSPQAAAAVEFTRQTMKKLGLDSVILQEVSVPVWERGEPEYANITSSLMGSHTLNVCALGKSIGTGDKGIVAEVIEVKSFEELDKLGSKEINGKIVFYNRAEDPKLFSTFAAYGGAVNQRSSGASKAAKYGAIGVVVRSATLALDDSPHTGGVAYDPNYKKIPAIGISTNDANLLELWLGKDQTLKLYFRTTSDYDKRTISNNVIGVIKGTEKPDEIITVGGHLDSWNTGEGAHDDGGGCVQAIEVLRLFKTLNIKPRHTIRAVMFMDEEMEQSGGRAYLAEALKHHEKHITAIESDRGVTSPTAFSIDADAATLAKVSSWLKYFKLYGINDLRKEGSGVDVGPLKELKIPLFGLITDDQKYFDYHHSSKDVFENVNIREMQLGSAALAAFIYFVDKYGL